MYSVYLKKTEQSDSTLRHSAVRYAFEDENDDEDKNEGESSDLRHLSSVICHLSSVFCLLYSGIAQIGIIRRHHLNQGSNWRGENTHHAALNFYPIFIPLFEAKVSGVSVQDML
jgi:hypothetical protein